MVRIRPLPIFLLTKPTPIFDRYLSMLEASASMVVQTPLKMVMSDMIAIDWCFIKVYLILEINTRVSLEISLFFTGLKYGLLKCTMYVG